MTDKVYRPYKSINVFLERDYLESVLSQILDNLDHLAKEDQIAFNQMFRKYIHVLGFRNPVRAPLPLQVKAYASAFEDKDEIVPFTLSLWTKLNIDFAEKVKQWLQAEGWDNLSFERRFEESEGFGQEWPEDLTFEQLEDKYQSANPKDKFDRNDLILMVIWITGNLPKE